MPQFILSTLLQKKGLDQNLFQATEEVKAGSEIEEHAKYLFNHIYSIPYPNQRQYHASASAIPRPYHGIMHVSRAAHYLRVGSVKQRY